VSGRHQPGSRECRELFAKLSEYLDGELTEATCAGVDEHLEDCPPCVAFLESLRRTVRMIESAEGAPLPDEVRQSLRETWRKMNEGPR